MKQTWEILMVIALLFGTSGTILAALIESNNPLMVVGATLIIMLICKLMTWRNEVREQTEARHKEAMKMLYGIYKAASREN